jgi:hypothetical protein
LDLRLYEEASRVFELKLKAIADRWPDNPAPDMAWLADGEQFTPDRPVVGYGWHERELQQDKWLCWNSSSAATLDLRLSKAGFSTFQCLLSHVISQAALDQLQISLNAVPLFLQRRAAEGGVLLEGAVPRTGPGALQHSVRITFNCPVMLRPCDIDPNSTDSRSLGVAIGWIRIN